LMLLCQSELGIVRSGKSSSAPKRRHSPPTNVPKFTSTMFRVRPVVGTTNDATAETSKATEPNKLRAVIHHGQAAKSPTAHGVTHFKPRELARCEKARQAKRLLPMSGYLWSQWGVLYGASTLLVHD